MTKEHKAAIGISMFLLVVLFTWGGLTLSVVVTAIWAKAIIIVLSALGCVGVGISLWHQAAHSANITPLTNQPPEN